MQVQDRIQELLAPPPTCESSGAHGPQCPWSELLATFQLHLVCQLLPDGQQRTGSVGWAGQQLLKPGPFFLTENKESRGQHGENPGPTQQPQTPNTGADSRGQNNHEVQYQGAQAAEHTSHWRGHHTSRSKRDLLGAAVKAEADDQGAVAVALCKRCLPPK